MRDSTGVKRIPQRIRPEPFVTREAILEEAAALFRRKGYRATTLEDIGGVFGISRPALYHYFSSKVEILIALYKRVFGALMKMMDSMLESDAPPVVKLARVLRYQTIFMADNANMVSIYFEEEKEISAELREQIHEMRKQYNRRLRDLYEDGVQRGDFIPMDSRLTINVMVAGTNWIYRWYSPDGVIRKEDYAAMVVRMLLRGCLQDTASMKTVEQVLAEPLGGDIGA